jgi:hypothetical protein
MQQRDHTIMPKYPAGKYGTSIHLTILCAGQARMRKIILRGRRARLHHVGLHVRCECADYFVHNRLAKFWQQQVIRHQSEIACEIVSGYLMRSSMLICATFNGNRSRVEETRQLLLLANLQPAKYSRALLATRLLPYKWYMLLSLLVGPLF